jgi:hypothetical protein
MSIINARIQDSYCYTLASQAMGARNAQRRRNQQQGFASITMPERPLPPQDAPSVIVASSAGDFVARSYSSSIRPGVGSLRKNQIGQILRIPL